jgi:membrane protein
VGPVSRTRPRALALSGDLVRRWREERIFGRAAEVSFFALLSLPPSLLAVFGGIGYLANALGPEATERIRDRVYALASVFLTDDVIADIIEPAVESVLSEGRPGIIGAGVLLALWSASRATTVLMVAVRDAYGAEERRPRVKRRLIAFAVTLIGMVAAVIVLPLLVLGPRLGAAIGAPFGLEEEVLTVWRILYWPVAGLTGIALLAYFYDAAVPGRSAWRAGFPGALFAAGIWLLAGAALRLYVSRFIPADPAYGSLAAPVVVLLWLQLSSLAVILGAVLNAVLEARRGPEVAEVTKQDPSREGETAPARLS